MGILVITWNFPPRRGGIESLIGHLCASLKKKHSVFVITSHAACDIATDEAIFRPRWPGLLGFFLYAVFRGAVVLYRNHSIKVILGGSALMTPLVLVLARLFRRRAVVQTHGLDLTYRNRVYQLLCVRWLRHCDRVIANSQYTASLAVAKRAPQSVISVIPPGIDSRRFATSVPVEALKKEMDLEGKRVMLFVGRLARRKGLGEFIQFSLAEIVKAIPEACLLIVGENPTASLTHRDDVLSEIRVIVADLQLENHVRFLGSVNDEKLVKIYQLCDVVVLPVLEMKEDIEGFGIVLLEAAAAGKPSVATRLGGMADAVEDGKSGILVGPQDYDALRQTLIQLLRNDTHRRIMGRYARERIEQQFSWDQISERYELAFASPY